MLSILIPAYNYNVFDFVNKLHIQCKNHNIIFEIIVIEDSSTETYQNKKLQEFDNVCYYILEKNIGRAKIRNLLAEKSKYDNLLFIDCDSDIYNDYIEKYLSFIKKNNNYKIVYGGREYTKELTDKKYLLHWKYGTQIEAKSVEQRKKEPNKSFMTNNFLIKKEIFNKIKFNEKITGYGHEDTLFGIELLKNNIKIIHINNPVIHIGLDNNNAFLEKTLIGIRNLKFIYKTYPHKDLLLKNIKLLRYYKKYYFLKPFLLIYYSFFSQKIIKNLKSSNPSLKRYSLFKLINLYKVD